MKRVTFFKTFAFFLFLAFASCSPSEKEDSAEVAQTKNEQNFGTRDGEKEADFVVRAVEDHYAEIKLAQLAINKSSDTNLKEIARILEEDNSKVLNELKDLSYEKGIAIPVEESENIKNEIQDLQKKTQGDFNKDWLKKIRNQHEATMKNFESLREKTQDAELKSWITGTLHHLHSLDSMLAYNENLK